MRLLQAYLELVVLKDLLLHGSGGQIDVALGEVFGRTRAAIYLLMVDLRGRVDTRILSLCHLSGCRCVVVIHIAAEFIDRP